MSTFINNNDINELLKRTCLNEIVPNYDEINGYTVGCNYKKMKHLIDDFEVRDNDVWVSSYAKSGNCTRLLLNFSFYIINTIIINNLRYNMDSRDGMVNCK